MAYASAQELQVQANFHSNINDATLTAMLDAASQAIDQYCNRPDGFEADAVASARVYASIAGDVCWIDECVEVTLVEVRYSEGESYSSWDADAWLPFCGDPKWPDYNRKPYAGIMVSLAAGVVFPVMPQPGVRVTARWGYAESVPPVIKQAAITQAARWYKRSQSGWSDVIGDGTFGTALFVKTLDPDVEMMLRGARMIRPALG